MQPKIEEVLTEANLTESQIGQITSAVGEMLSTVRSAHVQEVKTLEESKDVVIGGLMRDLVEKNRLLEEAAATISELKNAGVVVLSEAFAINDGALKGSVVDGEIVFESTDAEGKARRIALSPKSVIPLTEAVLAAPEQLDERVVVKPRRVMAQAGDSALGIDLDNNGALAFTVTDSEGSSLFELSRPDSEAVKDWFRMLQEAADKAGVKPDEEDEDKEELEERIRGEVIADVNKMLAEALRQYAPAVRRAREYDSMVSLVEGLQKAFGDVLADRVLAQVQATSLQESTASSERLQVLEESNKQLAEEVVALRQQAVFAERTAGLAATTRERVQMVVEAAKPGDLEEFVNLLEVAIQSVRPAAEPPAPAPAAAAEPPATSSLIDSVVAKL